MGRFRKVQKTTESLSMDAFDIVLGEIVDIETFEISHPRAGPQGPKADAENNFS